MARHDEGFFTAKDQLRLFWTMDVPEEAPRAHVLLVHGYGDHIRRYRFVTEALVADGFAVHGFDYRGHGSADGPRGFCTRWPEYLDDLTLAWERMRKAAGGQKLFLLGHSHGGLMVAHFLERGAEGVAGAVLSAPYFKLALAAPVAKRAAARMGSRVFPSLRIKSGLKPEDLSHDPEVIRMTREDPLYLDIVTPRWFVESGKAQDEALSQARRVTAPIFIFCGSNDGVAAPAAARTFFEAVGSPDKKFKEYPGMLHEPLNEVGREDVFRDISGWISAHL
ncbi:alpha/beta hydrolase [Stigmatella aurantiaca]|uniref:Lysophospholipase AgmH n=1 Tax=Stigmatella aurantiaca (strain DW4/3-1) TaxID=378806 RepID=E3FPI6_STIAD|nr:alpha/beta hydrolase [Stigmatella aurantiaca]ADO73181.1 Lysophospholipase AgmH [Stigmatella aurantiaca DW4/3-1]